MGFLSTIALTGILIWFIILLQKWRRTTLQSASPFASNREKQRIKIYAFLIDVFSLGLIVIGIMQVLFLAGVLEL